MKSKLWLTVVLLAFVGVSIAVMALKETRALELPAPAQAAVEEPARIESRIVAYYFHGTQRCATCNAIEKQSQEAVQSFFGDQIAAGDVEWRVVNFDKPENEHFVTDFAMSHQSVVLVEEKGRDVVRWQNLADVWTKIHEEPRVFEEYIVTNMADFTAAGGS